MMMNYLAISISGALTWWASEYLLHRFLGHSARPRTEFGKEHTRHHSVGNYFAPTRKKVWAAVRVSALLMVIGSFAASIYMALAFTIGFVISYASYEIFHRRCHTHGPSGPIGRWLRKHHFHHHFENPKANHGVTVPFGDWLFGTRDRPTRVRVPEKLAMCWLLDPATGDVKEEYRADYELRRRTIKNRKSAPAQTIQDAPVVSVS